MAGGSRPCAVSSPRPRRPRGRLGSSALEKLAGELETDAAKSSDAAKVRTLEGAVKQLAGTTT